MIYTLFLTLFILLIGIYKSRILSASYLICPSIIILSTTLVSTLCACINIDSWGDIKFITYVIIVLSILSFLFGSSFVFFRGSTVINSYPALNISRSKTYYAILFMVLITFLEYKDVVNMVGKAGLGIMALSAFARDSIYTDNIGIQHNIFVLHGLYISRALGYIFGYMLCYQKLILNKKTTRLYLIPVFLYFIQIILNTGRSEFIYIIFGLFVMGYILFKSKRKWSKNDEGHSLKYILYGASSFFAIFAIIGLSRKETDFDILSTITHYTGSSIPALDIYLSEHGYDSQANYWGEQTQALYYSVTNALGYSKFDIIYTLQPTYLKSGAMTNIYTCICRYLYDFGMIGTLFILFILGLFYSNLLALIKSKNLFDFRIIIFAFVCYPLAEFSIEERFFSNFLCARSFYIIFYIYLFYKLILEEKNK